jgi:hypothetical protein
LSRTCKFTALGAFFRLEARATPERWMVNVFRNGSFISEMEGRPRALDDDALAQAFEVVKIAAEKGIWDPGRTLFPWDDK